MFFGIISKILNGGSILLGIISSFSSIEKLSTKNCLSSLCLPDKTNSNLVSVSSIGSKLIVFFEWSKFDFMWLVFLLERMWI